MNKLNKYIKTLTGLCASEDNGDTVYMIISYTNYFDTKLIRAPSYNIHTFPPLPPMKIYTPSPFLLHFPTPHPPRKKINKKKKEKNYRKKTFDLDSK